MRPGLAGGSCSRPVYLSSWPTLLRRGVTVANGGPATSPLTSRPMLFFCRTTDTGSVCQQQKKDVGCSQKKGG